LSASIELSEHLLDWARVAGYARTVDSDAVVDTLWSDPGGEVRYYIRRRADGWYLLTRSSRGGEEQFIIAAVTGEVLERFLYGVLGTVIRDDRGLPPLKKPWSPTDLASGYTLSDLSEDGYRSLSLKGSGPIAVAREKTISLMNLVPLSHYLGLSLKQLEDSFLDVNGAPLMAGSSYALVTP
jgi:hypothetical protein